MTTLFLVARGDETTTGVGGGMVMHRELFYLGGVLLYCHYVRRTNFWA